jgi:2-oxoglutarate ferredoxin oxidoreductase subunit alpha
MDYMRIRAFPFHADVEAFLEEHDYCYVVEQNRDGQLRSMLILETPVAKDKLRPVLIYSGFPLSAKNVLDVIALQVEELDAIYR